MSRKVAPVLVWFRLDLRLDDNPALQRALQSGKPVIPVYVRSPEDEKPWAAGAASNWWLHHSLRRLDGRLRERGLRLVRRSGPAESVIGGLVDETGADSVYWNRRYEPALVGRDARIKKALQARGIDIKSHNGLLLFEPHAVKNKSGRPFQVFTPFWKHCCQRETTAPVSPPRGRWTAPVEWPRSENVDDWALLPEIDWAAAFPAVWLPGEEGARQRLEAFLDGPVREYGNGRNFPGREGVSRLSPHLHFGEISARRVRSAVLESGAAERSKAARQSVDSFLGEIGWREFAHHLLYHFPDTTDKPLKGEFTRFPWRNDRRALRAWRKGRTGYPFVDAGMRQLWRTGWLHNRARMVVGSFLVKDLLIAWQEGARWFWDTLVDADLASNTLGWQWVGGCGADAAPYFRVFNPVLQGRKFDPRGDYVREWVPELAKVPDKWIHGPWEAPAGVLADAGVALGKDYPHPIVDHKSARQRALRAYQRLKGG